MFCSNCGNKLADGAKFCSECGARVTLPDEQSFRTIADIDLEEPKLADEAVAQKEEFTEIPEAAPKAEPKREHISFDWSNVVDEPHRKEIPTIKSPWEDTGEIDEKELFAEMTPSTDKSRTMSFIDVLRAEKEEKERAAADSAIEYTEVLEIGHDLSAFDEPPELHYAPLYEDVDEPVKTPFDIPEGEQEEKEVAEEPRFETPDVTEKAEAPETEPAAEPEEPKIELSRETIAQFDEYVKSFEKEAGIAKDEPRIEKPLGGIAMPKFELPDFLKRDDEKEAEREPFAEISDEAVKSAVSDELFEEYDIKFDEDLDDEPDSDTLALDETPEQPVFEEPKYEDYSDGFDFVEDDIATGAEDLYLDLDNLKDEPSAEVKPEQPAEEDVDRPKHGAAEEPEDDEEDAVETAEEDEAVEVVETVETEEPAWAEETVEIVEEAEESDEPDEPEEAEEPVDEEDLFKEMTESSPKHTGMTIAEPADTQAEIEALKQRLAELMGTPVEGLSIEAETEELAEEEPEIEIEETSEEEPAVAVEDAAKEAEPEAVTEEAGEVEEIAEETAEADEAPAVEEPEPEAVDYGLYLEPESTSGVHDLFEGLTAVSQQEEEPALEAAPVVEEVVEAVAEPEIEEAAVEEAVPAEEVEAAEEPVIEETPVAETIEEVAEVSAEESPAAQAVETEPESDEVDYDFYLEPESTSGVHDLFEGLTAVSQQEEEPALEAAPVVEEIAEAVAEPEVEEAPVEEAAPVVEAVEAAEPVVEQVAESAPEVEEVVPVTEPVVEAAPVVEEVEAKSEPSVDDLFEELMAANKAQEEPVVEAAPVVEPVEEVHTEPVVEPVEEVHTEPVVEPIEEVHVEETPVVEAAPEPAPVVEEVVEKTVEAEPEELPSDALSLEELEKDLFGDVPEGEVEETKKIDKFYTLYKKNEEFQRLLDEEYEKLKSGGNVPEEPEVAEAAKAPEAPVEQLAEDKKAYRQVEDETIYMSKEDIAKQMSGEIKAEANIDAKPVAAAAAATAAAGAVFQAKTADSAPVELDANLSPKEKKAAEKAARKAEKAAKKAESRAKAGKSDAYDDPDAGSGVLTVLAVIIAIILVILLAVIVIMSVAPNSGIGIWINSHIQNITSGIGAVFPDDGQFLI